MKRAFNFGAGPAAIPTEVLEEAQKELFLLLQRVHLQQLQQ
jgi:phosphoserine aminotransferase